MPSWRTCHTAAGEPELAAARYRQVLSLEPDNAVALNNLAYDIAVRQNKPAEALPMARKALSVAPRRRRDPGHRGLDRVPAGQQRRSVAAAGRWRQGAPR